MIFIICSTCPARTQFFRAIGATEFHFGLLGGIPLIMLFMQFVGAAIANRVARRKGLLITLMTVGRVLLLPAVFAPLMLPGVDRDAMLMAVIVTLAVSASLLNMGIPLWFSWMADLVPRRVLNRYWGSRQRWMYVTWTTAYVMVAAFTFLTGLPATVAFPLLIVIGVAAGVMNVSLIMGVSEPSNHVIRGRRPTDVLLEPLRHKEYRTFVIFSCAKMAGVMFGAAFMQLYVLKVIGLSVWQATLIWCVSGVGNALTARRWGRLADKHGQRPLLTVCSSLKPGIAIVFLLITPRTALAVLPVAFVFDSMLNAGLMVGAHGYMMKIAPRRNRSMFIASITGLAGIFGGLAAIAGGAFLKAFSGFAVDFAGRTWINYHLLFLLSACMRFGAFCLSRRIREAKSSRSRHVLNDIRGVWPLRFLRFPIGLYRRNNQGR